MVSTTPPEDSSFVMDDIATTLTETIALRLRQDIVAGQLRPEMKLHIRDLAARYSVGTSPIREALNRLAADGLVTAEGHRGFRVAGISKEDLLDLTNVRILIETEALRLSIGKGGDAWEAGVVSAYHTLSKLEANSRILHNAEWERRNWQFHLATIAACGSERLLSTAQKLHNQHRRYRTLSYDNKVGNRNVHAEHTDIFKALLDHDIERACRAAATHIQNTANKILTADARKSATSKRSAALG